MEKYKEKRRQIYEENRRHEELAKDIHNDDFWLDAFLVALEPIWKKGKHAKR